MKDDLYIVESPTKANMIKNYGYNSVYTFGHLTELDFASFFKDNSINLIPKNNTFSFIENAIKKTKGKIIIGTDPDVEGENIAYTISEIAKKHKKTFIRNPLYGLSNKKISDFIYLKNQSDLDINKIKSSFARSAFDNILNQAFKKVLEEELDKKIKIGRVQHTVLLMIKEYKNYYIHSIGSYRLLSLKRIKNYKISKNKNSIVKIPNAFNSASLFMDGINTHKMEIQSIAKITESLYIEGFISYPRTEGIALEEDSYNRLYKKASELYNLNKMFFIGNYENAISPLNLEKRFSGNMNKIFNMIVRRSIASMLDNYLTTSLEYKLTFNGDKLKKISLLQDDKNILSKIYTPEYILDFGEEHKPYYIGNGVTEYEIVKLLTAYNIGKPSTLPYIVNILKNKKFISKDYDDTFSLLDIGNEILKIFKKRLPFLDIEFYQYINKDFEYISRGMQNWTFPILKLQNELKKNGINIDSVDFNYVENNEEAEYKKMWIDFENNEEKDFNDINLKNI
jgi:DNA topoisomerase IA